MKNPILCLIFGGKSSEYEISLRSAASALSHLDRKKYEIFKIGITKNGDWYLFDGDESAVLNDTWWYGSDITPVTLDFSMGSFAVFDETVYSIKPDIVFPIMHGAFGEDGRLQGALEMSGIKFIGCGALSSAVCMDKHLTKLVAADCKVPCAKGITLLRTNPKKFRDILSEVSSLGYPVFVKPCRCGSSVGVFRVRSENELYRALFEAFRHSDKVLVEEYIEGKETEIAVLERQGKLRLSTIGQLGYKSEFYDYDTKYNCGDVDYIIPAAISESSAELIREYARRLFYALECCGLCRMDFFVTKNGDVVFNEINTMPGFTDISMFPRLFINDGFSYEGLLDALIKD